MDISFESYEKNNSTDNSYFETNDFEKNEINPSEIILNKINCETYNYDEEINDESNNTFIYYEDDNSLEETPLVLNDEFIISIINLEEKENNYNMDLDENNSISDNNYDCLKELRNRFINSKKKIKINREQKKYIKQMIKEQKRKISQIKNNNQNLNLMNIKRNRYNL
jgi:hypothetical protein